MTQAINAEKIEDMKWVDRVNIPVEGVGERVIFTSVIEFIRKMVLWFQNINLLLGKIY